VKSDCPMLGGFASRYLHSGREYMFLDGHDNIGNNVT
jgi:hypothetical protein